MADSAQMAVERSHQTPPNLCRSSRKRTVSRDEDNEGVNEANSHYDTKYDPAVLIVFTLPIDPVLRSALELFCER